MTRNSRTWFAARTRFAGCLCAAAFAVTASPEHTFCGLARTVNGFDLVDAAEIGCADARAAIVRIERGRRDAWQCSRGVNAVYELKCVNGAAVVRVLERSPVPVVRVGDGVRLVNWSFRVAGPRLEAREGRLGWISLGRAPWCVPFDGPREVLVALRLRPVTFSGGCFVLG